MRKITFKTLFLSFVLFLGIIKVNAACNISVSSQSSVVVGSTFKVSATVSSDVGSWYYVLSYDTTKVQLVSGNTKVVGVIGDSKTNTYTFKALKSGTATFTASNASLASNQTNQICSASVSSSSTTMKTQAEIEASYSKNNNLSSITIENGELMPSFSPDITEYNVELPVDTEIAKINAVAQDNTAKIEGIGEIEVQDGINKIEIIVTAQHGEKKVYTLNVIVKEQDPVKVKVQNKTYTLVRKKVKDQTIPNGFIEKQIKISNQNINAYYNETTKTTLVNLKDDKGNIKLFIYDKREYKVFNQVESKSLNLIVLNNLPKIKCLKKTTIKINNEKTFVYKLDGNNYYVVYAKDLETGKEDLYLYDKKSNVYQIFFKKYFDKQNENLKLFFIISSISISIILIIFLKKFFSLFISKKRKIEKLTKKINKLSKKSNDYYEEDKPSIKQIDEDYTIPKKNKKQKLKEIKEAKEKLDKSKPSYKSLFDDED